MASLNISTIAQTKQSPST